MDTHKLGVLNFVLKKKNPKKQKTKNRGKQHLKSCMAKNIILCCFDYFLSFPFFMCVFVFYCLENDSL